jgi:hypothetical protein
MKSLVSFLAVYGASLCYAQTTNFFLSPGSQQEQLDSGNNTDGYPVYARNDKFTFTWMTNWTRVSLILYQNENASALRLFGTFAQITLVRTLQKWGYQVP